MFSRRYLLKAFLTGIPVLPLPATMSLEIEPEFKQIEMAGAPVQVKEVNDVFLHAR
jgi:hypothetical protein